MNGNVEFMQIEKKAVIFQIVYSQCTPATIEEITYESKTRKKKKNQNFIFILFLRRFLLLVLLCSHNDDDVLMTVTNINTVIIISFINIIIISIRV